MAQNRDKWEIQFLRSRGKIDYKCWEGGGFQCRFYEAGDHACTSVVWEKYLRAHPEMEGWRGNDGSKGKAKEMVSGMLSRWIEAEADVCESKGEVVGRGERWGGTGWL